MKDSALNFSNAFLLSEFACNEISRVMEENRDEVKERYIFTKLLS